MKGIDKLLGTIVKIQLLPTLGPMNVPLIPVQVGDFRFRQTYGYIPDLLLISSVVLGKFFNFPRPQFLHL